VLLGGAAAILASRLLAKVGRAVDRRQLLILFVLAFALRCIGLLWGGVHEDEDPGAAARVLAGQLVPNQHYYPPLLNYLVAVGYAFMFVGGFLLGIWRSASEFGEQYFTDPTPFLFVLRVCVALISACAAPLAVMIARQLSMGRAGSLAAGIMIAVLPLSVLWSHFGKVDPGVGTSLMLASWALIGYSESRSIRDVVWFGVAMALAMSFKHSALFMGVPLTLAFFTLGGVRDGSGLRRTARHTGIFLGVAIVVWIPLNVGLWMDIANFLEYQELQLAMTIRSAEFSETLAAVLGVVGGNVRGATPLLLLAFLAIPLLWRRAEVISIWLAVMVSILVTAVLSGDRASPQIYFPQSLLAATLGSIMLVRLARRTGWQRWVGVVFLLLSAANMLWWTAAVWQQSFAPTVSSTVEAALLRLPDIEDRKILASKPRRVGLPISRAAIEATVARDESLASKYQITLPKRRRPLPESDAVGFYVSPIPWVIGGLEAYQEDELEVVKPFAWPIQPEEWSLDYWTDQGYTVFVVENEASMLESEISSYRKLHQQIAGSCRVLADIATEKTFFLQGDAKVYLFEGAIDPSPD
jgi:hypothetical protein